MDHIGENIALVRESEFYYISKFEKKNQNFYVIFYKWWQFSSDFISLHSDGRSKPDYL